MPGRRITITVKRTAVSPSEATVLIHIRDVPGALQPSQWVNEGEKLLKTFAESGARARVEDMDEPTDKPVDRDELDGLEIELADVASRATFELYLARITAAAKQVNVWCYEPRATRLLKLFGEAADATAFTVSLAGSP